MASTDPEDFSQQPLPPPAWREPPPPPDIPDLLKEPVHRHAPPPPPKAAEGGVSTAKAWAVAMDFVFTIIGSLLLGYFADSWFKTKPLWTMVGLGAGFVFALWRFISRMLKEDRAERAARDGRGRSS